MCAMLRLMGMRRVAVVLAVVALLAGCGQQTSVQSSEDDAPKERLLAAADAAADRKDGKALRVEAVRTTRRAAEGLTGHISNQADVPVWVTQVSGTTYACGGCSRPPGAVTPTGRFLMLVVTADAYEGTSGGISPNRYDLSSLGEVEVLRDKA
jgi:uncharacterized protein YceK